MLQLSQNTDVLELYSFVAKLYATLLYYHFIFKQNILVMIVIKIITLLLFKFLLSAILKAIVSSAK